MLAVACRVPTYLRFPDNNTLPRAAFPPSSRPPPHHLPPAALPSRSRLVVVLEFISQMVLCMTITLSLFFIDTDSESGYLSSVSAVRGKRQAGGRHRREGAAEGKGGSGRGIGIGREG